MRHARFMPRPSIAVATVIAALAGCESPTGIAGLFVRVGGEYDLMAAFTTTYDCDPLAAAPRDSLICGSETAIVTTQIDTLTAHFTIDDFCNTENCLSSSGVGRFAGSGSATWSSRSLRPDPASTVHEYGDLTVQVTPYVIDCSADDRRRNGEPALCVGHEQETIVTVSVGLEPLGVSLGRGLPAGSQITGDFSNFAGPLQPRFLAGTTWTLH
jgi:hypothetical protein